MPKKIVNLYFGSSGDSKVYDHNHHLGDSAWIPRREWFFYYDSAKLIAQNENLDASPDTVKIGVGCQSSLTGSPIKKIAEREEKRIRKFLSSYPDYNLVVNALGTSQGAVAALLLTKKLMDVAIERLTINLIVLDPVPGNLLTTQQREMSAFGATLTQQTIDLSECKHIKDVLCLYAQDRGTPRNPLNHFFSQLLPQWPLQARVEEDVCSGDHTRFLYALSAKPKAEDEDIENLIISQRCLDFLSAHGYRLAFDKLGLDEASVTENASNAISYYCKLAENYSLLVNSKGDSSCITCADGVDYNERLDKEIKKIGIRIDIFKKKYQIDDVTQKILSLEKIREVEETIFEFCTYEQMLDYYNKKNSFPKKMLRNDDDDENVSSKEEAQKNFSNQLHTSLFEKAVIYMSSEIYYNLHHASLVLNTNIYDLSNKNCSLRVERTTLRSTFDNTLNCKKEILLALCQVIMAGILPKDYRSNRYVVLSRIENLLRIRENLPMSEIFICLITLLLQKDNVFPQDTLQIIITALNDYPIYTELKIFIADTLSLPYDRNITAEILINFVLVKGSQDFFDEKNKNKVYDFVSKRISFLVSSENSLSEKNTSLSFSLKSKFSFNKTILLSFGQHINENLLKENCTGKKRRILKEMLDLLEEIENETLLPTIFVLLIALALQQEDNGLIQQNELKMAIEALNIYSDYVTLKGYILAHLNLPPDSEININTLRSFALTENDDEYFQQKNADKMYNTIKNKIAELSDLENISLEDIASGEDAWDFLGMLPHEARENKNQLIRPIDFLFFQENVPNKYSQQTRPNQRRI